MKITSLMIFYITLFQAAFVAAIFIYKKIKKLLINLNKKKARWELTHLAFYFKIYQIHRYI